MLRILCLTFCLLAVLLSKADAQDVTSKVSFRDDQTILVRGKPFFPIGLYYCQEELDDATGKLMKELRELGINTMGYYRWNSPNWRHELDTAHAKDLMIWYRGVDGFAVADDAGETRVVEQLRTYRNHPSLLMWEFQDEPILNMVSVEHSLRGQAIVRREDPNHPLLVCHWPGAVDRWQEWKALGDVVSTDLYPIPREKGYGRLANKDITQMKDYLARLRETHGNKPRMLVLQAWSWDPIKFGRHGYPTPAESRFMAYQAVVHGAKGILYYGQYHCTKPNSAAALWSEAADPAVREQEYQQCLELNRTFWNEHKPFFKELDQAAKIFVLRDADKTSTFVVDQSDNQGSVAILTKRSGEQLYAIAINESATATKVAIKLPAGLGNSQLHVLFEDRTIDVKDGKCEDFFKPYDVHVYGTTDRLP